MKLSARFHHSPRRPDEGGYTLLELLVSIAIMAIAFVVVLGGISVFFSSTRIHQRAADLDAAARTYAERLEAAPYNPACVYGVAAPAGYSPQVQTKLWTGTNPATFVPCPAQDFGVQQLTVTLTHTDGAGKAQSDQFVIVKRDPKP